MKENKNRRLVIIWDGATYHRSQEWREYLDQINQGKKEEEWLIKMYSFSPKCSRTKSNRRCLVTSQRNVTKVLAFVS